MKNYHTYVTRLFCHKNNVRLTMTEKSSQLELVMEKDGKSVTQYLDITNPHRTVSRALLESMLKKLSETDVNLA